MNADQIRAGIQAMLAQIHDEALERAWQGVNSVEPDTSAPRYTMPVYIGWAGAIAAAACIDQHDQMLACPGEVIPSVYAYGKAFAIAVEDMEPGSWHEEGAE